MLFNKTDRQSIWLTYTQIELTKVGYAGVSKGHQGRFLQFQLLTSAKNYVCLQWLCTQSCVMTLASQTNSSFVVNSCK